MKTFVLFLTTFIIQSQITAQKISGAITDTENKPLNAATVTLLNSKDSSVVKLNATNTSGNYVFEGIEAGSYFIMATTVGYNKAYSAAFEYTGDERKIETLQLSKAATELSAVVVTAKKPMIEVKADKMIVNIEGTINAAGNDALELLRRSPGVLVDKDDNLSMAGKSGVRVYIDGKPSPLRGSDLANYLKSLQSSSIEAIELITNPSAKYEAEGNAGIINIRLKKNKAEGLNGSVTAGYNVAKYSKYNGGINLNYRVKKINVFGNYNYNQGLYYSNLTLYRDQADSLFDQYARQTHDNKSHNFKAGADYYINSKNTIGMLVNGSISNSIEGHNGSMTIAPKSTGVVNKILKANSDINQHNNNVNYNLNYRYADTSGHELNVDADYGYYNIKSDQFIPNIYYDGTTGSTELYRNVYRMVAPTHIDIYALKADYEQPFKKGKLGYGGKIGYVKTDNDFSQYNIDDANNETYDYTRSNRFKYTENVNALYVNYNRQLKGIAIQLGVRMENTSSKGLSAWQQYDESSGNYIPGDSAVKRNYTDFFPSTAITFNKNPMSVFNITYSRRIDRPDYQNMNPFEFKLNDYTYSKGNTQLKPQYTNSFGITHTYKYKLNTSLTYSHVSDMFARILEPEGSVQYQTYRNLATQDVLSLNVSYPFNYKWYSFFTSLTGNYTYYKADFGGNKTIDRDFVNGQFYMQNTFKLGRDLTAELTGLYLTPFIWEGTFRGKSMGFVSAGLQKNVLKGKGNIKAIVDDIFKTMKFNGVSNYAGAYTRVGAAWESRMVKLNFTYRFGSAQIKAARQRKTGLDDESKRAQSNGGNPGQ
ncbi:MAG: TonB-dependent receptor [Niabella sp.]